MLLDGAGFLNGTDAHLTLSFAGDGAQIAGQSNALAATFDVIAPRAQWQAKILEAFQTWAVNTNADVGVVSDGGQPFGTPGSSQKDPRFGEIRVGAVAMAPSAGAVSVPIDGLVSGTWFADVVFNTNFNYQTLDDIFAVAIHEAGNVFGLEDNTDPNSPLFPSDPPVVRLPTANDIAALQSLHGARTPDYNEGDDDGGPNAPTDNDSFINATELKKGELAGASSGTAPSIVYGDISSNTDLDFFKLDAPGGYFGSMTVDVRSNGISLLSQRLRVYNGNEQLLGEASSFNTVGATVTVQIPTIDPNDNYFFEISGADPGVMGIGGYSLVVKFDGINAVGQATINAIAGGDFRFLEQEDISKFFDADEDDFFNDDQHTDDVILNATVLPTVIGFVDGTRYETIGSITDATDIDFYAVKSPVTSAVPNDVLTVQVRSIDLGGLIPQISILDDVGALVASKILSNGGGEYIIQVDGVLPDSDYILKVEAATPGSLFDTGNYTLVATFTDQPTVLTPLASATIGNGVTQRIHTLHIGKPQLFHFALQADAVATTAPTAVLATIVNDQGTPVYQLAAQPGETRSREAVLLAPGSYTVEVVVWTLDGSVAPEFSYSLEGVAISDLFVGDPNDPTSNPFACTEPGMEGFFCYPGGIVSPDPFLWDSFIDSLTTPPPTLPTETLVTILFGDWWSWVWSEFGVNGPAFAQDDTYHTNEGAALSVPAGSGAAGSGNLSALVIPGTGGILNNDVDPENGELVTILKTGVSNGTLTLAVDGGFDYTPNVGFTGIDEFTYTAYDFNLESNIGTVKIVVGISGDFNASGSVDGFDFLTWQRGVGTSPATLTDGDSDLDGVVGPLDLAVWQSQYSGALAPTPSNGDADADGDVDGTDFLAWQRGFGITTGATAADGDANADGAVDAVDLGIWQTNYGTAASAALALSQSFQAASTSANIAAPTSAETSRSQILGGQVAVPASSSSNTANSGAPLFATSQLSLSQNQTTSPRPATPQGTNQSPVRSATDDPANGVFQLSLESSANGADISLESKNSHGNFDRDETSSYNVGSSNENSIDLALEELSEQFDQRPRFSFR